MTTPPTTILRKAKLTPPAPAVEQQDKKRGPFAGLVGQYLTIQSRTGVIYVGRLAEILAGCIKLDGDVEIVGAHHRVKTPWVIIERNMIAHFHLADIAVIEKINETDR